MRSKLISSLLTLTLFWWGVLFLSWAFQSPTSNLTDIGWARPVANLLGFAFPAQAGWFDGIKIQGLALLIWTAPVMLASVLAFAAGFRSAWVPHKHDFEEGEAIKQSGTGVRGVTATLGDLPGFPDLPREDLEFDAELMLKLTEPEKALLSAVFGVLVAHPDARAGEGHTSIVDQAEALAMRELTDGGPNPGLSAIAAVSRLMGNIRSYEFDREKGDWVQIRPSPARTGELMLASLPEWWGMPEDARVALAWAVGFWDNAEDMPVTPAPIARMAMNILRQAKDLDKGLAAQVTQAAVEQTKKDFDLIELFLAKLPALPFQNGLPKGVHAVGWRKGNLVYLIENQLVDKYLLPSIPAERRKAMQEVGKGHKLSNLSRELMNRLSAKGWLVTECAGFVLPVETALWKLQAGKILYKRIIALDFSNAPDIRDMLPIDSFYPISVTEPHFEDGTAKQVFSANELGGLFRPGGAPAGKKPASGLSNPPAMGALVEPPDVGPTVIPVPSSAAPAPTSAAAVPAAAPISTPAAAQVSSANPTSPAAAPLAKPGSISSLIAGTATGSGAKPPLAGSSPPIARPAGSSLADRLGASAPPAKSGPPIKSGGGEQPNLASATQPPNLGDPLSDSTADPGDAMP